MKLATKAEWQLQLELRVSTPELGYGPAIELIRRRAAVAAPDQFTAIVCYNDIAAIGTIKALREHRLRVPEDISVVGFDDIQAAAFQNPSLTTIRQPLRNMGATAARILLQRIRGQKADTETVPVLPELVIRESTITARVQRGRKKSG
jgi:LacI family transcriptional regulator